MQGPVSGAVLCIRETGDPYVILNGFPCGPKIQTSLYYRSEGRRVSTCPAPPVPGGLSRLGGISPEVTGCVFSKKRDLLLVLFPRVWMRETRSRSPHRAAGGPTSKVLQNRDRLEVLSQAYCCSPGLFGLKPQRVEGSVVLWKLVDWLCYWFILNLWKQDAWTQSLRRTNSSHSFSHKQEENSGI